MAQDLNRLFGAAAVPIFPTSYADVSEGFREKYGARNWIGELAKTISGSPTKSGKEYKAARRSLERVATGQYTKPGPKYTERIKEAGTHLDPLRKDAPKEGLTINVRFQAPAEKRHRPRTREFSVHMPYEVAVEYINTPDPPMGPIWNAWFNDGDWASGDTQGEDTYGDNGDYVAGGVEVSL